MSSRREPPVTPVSEPFWAATRDRRLLVQRCDACRAWVWYPRTACTACLAPDLTWTELSGTGTVYAVSVHQRPGVAEMKDRTPYAVALIDLEEGVRMLSNVVDCDPETVHVGQRVAAAWEPLSDGRHLLVFQPVGS